MPRDVGAATIALVVEVHGALEVDLGAGRATPLGEDRWLELEGGPAVPEAARARLLGLPAAMPVYLRWDGRWPEWFDAPSGTWIPVDATTLRELAESRRPAQPSAPAPQTTPSDLGPEPPRDLARCPVWPVEYHERPQPNLALATMLAAAADHPGIVERFDLRPVGTARPSRLRALAEEPRGVLLFSHYTWSTRGNLLQSAAAKAANDRFITVHGGPNVPGFTEDVERFLGENPHVDVLVHGEGEATFVDLMSRIGETGLHDRADPDRLALLGDIPGLTVRVGDRIVRGPKRPRISDLDATPSAYLAGQFDQVALAGSMAVIETNRGCPFGCTFCDWGSATRSRVRTFGLDRVRAEVRWLAERGVDGIFVADANFGAFERDLEIARAIADAKRAHGAPRQVMFTFAKDTAELLIPIVDLLWDVGIDVDGNLALQTVDEPTLRIVRRKNLPEPEYRRVRAQFRERGLPLTSDIMLGLPGSTYESMRADVQFCLDHEITPRAHRTVLLPNAPMRSPQHREEHAIVTDHLQRTVAGSTFTAEELKQVGNLHRLADAWDHYGIARLPLRWASRDHGIAEVEILERVDRLTRDEPSRYPAITWSAVGFTSWLVPPGTWEAFLGELRVWLVEALGVPDDDALASVLAAQAAVLPCPGASFPRRVELAHDVAAWLAQHAEAPGDRDQRRLLEFPPTVLEVDDDGANDALLVANRQSRAHTGRALREVRRIYGPSWELRSPLARAQMLSVEEHAFRFAE